MNIWFFGKAKQEVPQSKLGHYVKATHCKCCDLYSVKKVTPDYVCPKCGEEDFEYVVGRWEYRWIVHDWLGYFERYKFHPKDTEISSINPQLT